MAKEVTVNQDKYSFFANPRTEEGFRITVVKQLEIQNNLLARIVDLLEKGDEPKRTFVNDVIDSVQDVLDDVKDDGKRNHSNRKKGR